MQYIFVKQPFLNVPRGGDPNPNEKICEVPLAESNPHTQEARAGDRHDARAGLADKEAECATECSKLKGVVGEIGRRH